MKFDSSVLKAIVGEILTVFSSAVHSSIAPIFTAAALLVACRFPEPIPPPNAQQYASLLKCHMTREQVDFNSQRLDRFWCQPTPVTFPEGDVSYFCTAGHEDGETLLRFDEKGRLTSFIQGENIRSSAVEISRMSPLCE